MPTYKLVYFNVRARAEIDRLTFAAAGVKYEDERVIFDNWPALKPSTPTGKLPYLDIDDGKAKLSQSIAISRYIAREFGLASSDALEQAKIDEVQDTWYDIQDQNWRAKFEKNEVKKPELLKKQSEDLPLALAVLEKLLERNGGDGFFVGKNVSVADLQAIAVMDDLTPNHPDCLSKFPKLKAHDERVRSLPKIADYLARRPKTDF